ncbi:proline dehydrogenase family protein [Thermasporomyces composti]|uniref:proline dehydrogenase n=1 Tax=Thermasporomyces composti TaxID=696763 RepID=A0A3D9VA81_THECX|nr:proline dehydrogenase family protein [Thermasporomyces composti]REF37070.1 L-proline dehydrogenase [Thermasporomyces composti]
MVLRRALLAAARGRGVQKLASTMPVSSTIVSRFVAGETADEAIEVARQLLDEGIQVTIDHLGEHTEDREGAESATRAYLDLLDRLSRAGVARSCEVSLKLSALGRDLRPDGEKLALENTRTIALAARNAGTAISIDMEDYTTVDSTLSVVQELRRDFPETGAVLQAYLRRTEGDCRDLAYQGSRVRLCKGAYAAPESVAFRRRSEIDLSYVRCLKILMAGQGYPMVATHDPRLIEIASALAMRYDRSPGSYEFQMLYGVRPEEQRRLVSLGDTVRVYLPYGDQWYAYLMRRLAERPAYVGFFLRSLVTRS